MINFEVLIEDGSNCAPQLIIPADNWIEAWQLALEELGVSAGPRDVLCAIHPGERIVVVVRRTGLKLTVRSLGTDPAYRAETTASAPAPESSPRRRVRRRTTWRTSPNAVLESRRPTRDVQAVTTHVPGEHEETSAFGNVPYVGVLSYQPNKALSQAFDMLERHIAFDSAQFVIPARRRGRLVVAAARGRHADQLVGAQLDLEQAIVRFLDNGPARIALHGDGTPLEFARGLRRKLVYRVRSALCVPIVRGSKLLGAFMLQNAGRRTGFSEGELNALVYLAKLLGGRIFNDPAGAAAAADQITS